MSTKPTKRYARKMRSTKPKNSLAALAKQVRTLQKKTALVTENDTFYVPDELDVVSPYVCANLCNYSNWTKMWPSAGSAIQSTRSQMFHKSFAIDNLVTLDNINNEEGTIGFTYFIISRRDEAGTATDLVNSLTLTNNVDYRSLNGMAFMNLKKFKVHYCKRFTLTQMDIAGDGQESSNAQRRFTAKIKVGKKVRAPDGHWSSLTNSPDPSDTYYAVLFNDNSTADLENPRWTFNCLHQINN